jgi:hypothetical protein
LATVGLKAVKEAFPIIGMWTVEELLATDDVKAVDDLPLKNPWQLKWRSCNMALVSLKPLDANSVLEVGRIFVQKSHINNSHCSATTFCKRNNC